MDTRDPLYQLTRVLLENGREMRYERNDTKNLLYSRRLLMIALLISAVSSLIDPLYQLTRDRCSARKWP